jgi:hypothetical protein
MVTRTLLSEHCKYIACLVMEFSWGGAFTPGPHEAPLKNISVNIKIWNCCDFTCCFPRTMRSKFSLERQEVAGGRRKLYLWKAAWLAPLPNVKGSNEAERAWNYIALTAEMNKKIRYVEVLPPPPPHFLWRFDSILGHGLPLQAFAITLIGHATLGRTPLVEWSARHRDLYLVTRNTHERQTSKHSNELIPARCSN